MERNNIQLSTDGGPLATVHLFTPETTRGRKWLHENVASAMWLGNSLAVERRYVTDLAYGAINDGLVERPAARALAKWESEFVPGGTFAGESEDAIAETVIKTAREGPKIGWDKISRQGPIENEPEEQAEAK